MSEVDLYYTNLHLILYILKVGLCHTACLSTIKNRTAFAKFNFFSEPQNCFKVLTFSKVAAVQAKFVKGRGGGQSHSPAGDRQVLKMAPIPRRTIYLALCFLPRLQKTLAN